MTQLILLRNNQVKPAKALREMLKEKDAGILVVPGAFDALSAKLVEAAGFRAIYMTGFGTAASIFGVPDIGLLTMTEMVENAKRICDVTTIPLIVDADTGYGNHLNVIRTVKEYEKSGVAAIHIEDQVFPKKCGQLEGHRLIPVKDMVAKVRAAVDSRTDSDLIVIARTDAISAEGFEEAIERANAYLEEGADIAFVEGARTTDQLKAIPPLIRGRVLLNKGTKTPNLHFREFEKMGYSIIIYPSLSLIASFLAVRDKLRELKETGVVEAMVQEKTPGRLTLDDFVSFLGLKGYRDREDRFLR